MVTESITIHVLHVISLALSSTERWRAASHPFGASSALEGWLTVFAIVALISSVILVIWLSFKHKRTEEGFRREFAELKIGMKKLRREITELSEHESDEASEQTPSEESEEPVAIRES